MDTIDFTKLGHELQALQKSAVTGTLKQCKPLINQIKNTESRNSTDIESVLDMLNDVGFDSEVSLLFHDLCQYYSCFDPTSSANFTDIYIEMWGSEEEKG